MMLDCISKSFRRIWRILPKHLNSPTMKNATYLLTDTQTEWISILGKDLKLKNITSEIESSKFFSIIAGEATSYNNQACAFLKHDLLTGIAI